MPSDSPKLFISYSRREPHGKELVYRLKDFVAKRFPFLEVVTDEEGLRPRDSIRKFMVLLSQGDYVIFVLGEQFLVSPWCMNELSLTAMQPGYEERVFHLRFPGFTARTDTPADVAKVVKHWQGKWKELKQLHEEIAAEEPDHVTDEMREEEEIAKNLPKGCGKALPFLRRTIGIEIGDGGTVDWEELGGHLDGWVRRSGEGMGGKKVVNSRRRKLPLEIQKIVNDMILVEGGTFLMGSEKGYPNESPIHEVILSRFYICKYQVSQGQWEAIMGRNPSRFNDVPESAMRPVDRVSWIDCEEFIQRLNGLTNLSFRLPTEAEWEFAARGGLQSKGFTYAGGNRLEKVAWYKANSSQKTHPVGRKAGNELGLFDMSGNVWEWCQDWYNPNYYQALGNKISMNPRGPADGEQGVVRGGSWSGIPHYCRLSMRYNLPKDSHASYIGLRLAMD